MRLQLVYLSEFLNHLFNADVTILGDLVFHMCEPLTQLFVLLIKDGPLIQLLTHLLPAQRQLHTETKIIQGFLLLWHIICIYVTVIYTYLYGC